MQVLRISCTRVVTRWQNPLSKFELSEGRFDSNVLDKKAECKSPILIDNP